LVGEGWVDKGEWMDIAEGRDEGRLEEEMESFQIAGGWNSGMDKMFRSG
jgi:hypothetical protein